MTDTRNYLQPDTMQIERKSYQDLVASLRISHDERARLQQSNQTLNAEVECLKAEVAKITEERTNFEKSV
jgi:cell division protein FtsB